MKNRQLFTLLSIAVIFVFITSLFSTVNVLADDNAPPAPTEEPALPPTEEPAATEVPVKEDVSVDEILAQIPEETDLIVLDENGDALNLASADAAEVLIAPDPYFTVSGVLYQFTALDCDPGPAVTPCSNPIQAAVDFLATNDYTPDDGNIYVEASTYTENVTVDGSSWTTVPTYLGIIGAGSSTTSLKGYFEIYYMNAFTLSGFSVEDNGGGGNSGGYVFAADNNGTFTLNDLIVSNVNGNGPGGDGVDVVSHDGDINLTNVDSSNNYYSGAFLENCSVCGALGDITINSSVFSNNGMSSEQSTARGLRAWSNGNITLTDVTADWNAGGGAELINCFFDFFGGSYTCLNSNPGTATIAINGTNTFNNNGYIPEDIFGSGLYASVGLWVGSRDGATISGVTAQQNGMGDIAGGALFFAENGDLSISDSNFNENCMACGLGFGFIALNLGSDITINKITANDTGNQAFSTPYQGIGGLIINPGGNTFVTKSDFSNNCLFDGCAGLGLGTLSFGDVYLYQVTANSNGTDSGGGDGASINSGGNIDVYCSTFNNNFGYGLQVNTSGETTLNGVTISGNTLGDIDLTGSGSLIVDSFDCNPGKKSPRPALPINIIPVTGGFDCTIFSGTLLLLPNGDNALFPCPIQDEGKIELVSNDALPGSLPNGNEFISAFTTFLFKDGKAQETSEESIIISFMIPDGVDKEGLSILYWNGSEWTDLGGAVSADGLYFQVPTNLIGTFVLVSK